MSTEGPPVSCMTTARIVAAVMILDDAIVDVIGVARINPGDAGSLEVLHELWSW